MSGLEFKPQRPMRLVRAMLVDADDKVPMDHRLVYDSKEQFTDDIDQELFFNDDVVGNVKAHNQYRATLRDEDDKPLAPVRLGELVSAVVMLAKF